MREDVCSDISWFAPIGITRPNEVIGPDNSKPGETIYLT